MAGMNNNNAWRGTPFLTQGQSQNGTVDFSYNPLSALGNTSAMDMQNNNLYTFSDSMNASQNFTPNWDSLSKAFDGGANFMADTSTMFNPVNDSIFSGLPDWASLDNAKTGLGILQAWNTMDNNNKQTAMQKKAIDAQIGAQRATLNNNATELARIAQNRAEYEAANLGGHDYKSDGYNQQVADYNNRNQYERLG